MIVDAIRGEKIIMSSHFCQEQEIRGYRNWRMTQFFYGLTGGDVIERNKLHLQDSKAPNKRGCSL